VRGAVLAVAGVVDAYVTENNTGTDETIGTQVVKAHSLYVAVQGGTDDDVARAIWSKKPPGCDYSGSTTVTVEDDVSGYLSPPTYDVSFQRAAALSINFAVSIASRPDVPSDAVAQVTAAITEHFASVARIAQTVFASEFYCPVGNLGAWARLISITVNGVASQGVGINQFPAVGTITVTPV